MARRKKKRIDGFSDIPLASFKIDDLRYFHTGDIKDHIVSDFSEKFNPETHARIMFHIRVNDQNKTEISTYIPYTEPVTYEYMENYALSELTKELPSDQLPISVDFVYFNKMELKRSNITANTLIYHLTVENIKKNDLKNRSGLIIGRFQPLHKGHMYLFNKALEMVDFLEIGIGSSQMFNQPKNPFTFEERKNLIEKSMNEANIPVTKYQIHPIPDLFNFPKWINSIFNILPDFDVIFTNNLWIGRLIQQRGKRLIYGLKHNFEKFNGTYIRKLLQSRNEEWKSLVPASTIPFLEEWSKKFNS